MPRSHLYMSIAAISRLV